jgi:hypothetical protein
MRLPQIMSWTVGIQRELAKDLALDVPTSGASASGADHGLQLRRPEIPIIGNLLLQTAGSSGAARQRGRAVPSFTGYSRTPWHRPSCLSAVHHGQLRQRSGRQCAVQLAPGEGAKRYSTASRWLCVLDLMKNMATSGSNQYTPSSRSPTAILRRIRSWSTPATISRSAPSASSLPR